MNAVYSFWSKPFLANGKKVHGEVSEKLFALCWILSVHFAKRYFDKVKLVTDTEGYNALVELDLPFDNVSLELDEIPESILPEMWAYGKLIAYEIQKEPFVHIDYDAFLFKPTTEEMLKADIIVQHKEYFHMSNHKYYSTIRQIVKQWGFENDYYYNQSPYAYNLGMFGGNDLEFIKRYVAEAKQLALFPTRKMLNDLPNLERRLFPISFEQHILAAMCYEEKKEVFETGLNEDRMNQLGYFHLMGGKNNKAYLNLLERKALKECNSDYLKWIHKTMMKNPENYLSLNSYEI